MAQGNKFESNHTEAHEDWLLSYADMITLLMAFFIMLAAISKPDAAKYEQVQSGMAKDIGNRQTERPIENLKTDVKQVVADLGLDENVGIGTDEQGLVIEFPAATFFKSGSADIRDEARPALKQIGTTLNSQRYLSFQIEVQGHTDDTPIASPQYPTNWELSAARATAAVRLFVELGIVPTRLKAIGFADVAPKVPNRDANGTALLENQTINRRLMVRVYPR